MTVLQKYVVYFCYGCLKLFKYVSYGQFYVIGRFQNVISFLPFLIRLFSARIRDENVRFSLSLTRYRRSEKRICFLFFQFYDFQLQFYFFAIINFDIN